ncbi:MAG: uracil-DNA glycosylase [Limisphaerales bacterium]|jgi:uracil-DNA glycosylase
MGVDKKAFYDEKSIAIVAMGFCYPGKGKSEDLTPRPECAELWQQKILSELREIKLTLLIGQYAQKHFLEHRIKKTHTETVKNWQEYSPKFLPLPHPSPRNNIWLKKNPWFENDVVPHLEGICSQFL